MTNFEIWIFQLILKRIIPGLSIIALIWFVICLSYFLWGFFTAPIFAIGALFE